MHAYACSWLITVSNCRRCIRAIGQSALIENILATPSRGENGLCTKRRTLRTGLNSARDARRILVAACGDRRRRGFGFLGDLAILGQRASQNEGGEALTVSAVGSLGHEVWSAGHEERSASHEAWYAVWTQSHYENIVADQLGAKGFAAFLPEISVWSKREGMRRLIRVPMFPGYLFVHDQMDKKSYIEILKSRGVVRILEDGWTRLTPIPDDEIEAIQRVVKADVPVLPHARLTHGDRVEVTEGPLTGVKGIFVQGKTTKGRLVLTVDLLGRSVSVEVDCTAVKPCRDGHPQ
jgi:transcription termination/antitermination protein NusG